MAKSDFVTYDFLPRKPIFTPREAVKLCRERVAAKDKRCPHHPDVLGLCGHNAGCNYGFATCGSETAIGVWHTMPAKYRRRGLEAMVGSPAGAVLYWSGGSTGAGHAGISDGEGHVFGTDLPVTNQFGRFPIAKVVGKFPLLSPEGWAFPLFEHAASDNRKPPKVSPAEKRVRTPNIDEIIEAQQDIIAAAKRAILRRDKPEDDQALRRIITAARRQINSAQRLQAQPKK